MTRRRARGTWLRLLAVRGKSLPWPFSTWATPENAEGFRGCRSPHPAALTPVRAVWSPVVWLTALGLAAAEPPPLEFHRVHVPGERIGEVSLGTTRYVPMPLTEFDAAVARLEAARRAGTGAQPAPLADAARYEARIDDQGVLVGTLVLSVDADTVAVSPVVPLGTLPAGCSLSRVTGPGGVEGLVYAAADGSFSMRVPEAGEYTTTFACRPAVDGASRHRLPLVPALSSSLRLRLVAELRPLLSAAAARHAVVRQPAGDDTTWRIDVGPVLDATLTVGPVERGGGGGLALWTEHVLRGNESAVQAIIEPTTAWSSGGVELEHEPGLVVTAVEVVGTGERLETRPAAPGQVAIVVPAWLEGRATPLSLHGIAPATGTSRRLPLVRPSPQRWARGGMLVVVDPALAVTRVATEESRVVAPQAAERWHLPARVAATGSADMRRPAVFHVEQQGPAAALTIDVAPRVAAVEVARVTTVEISSGAVLGRAACDVRVLDGAAFDISARIAPGWIIDAVDIVEWPAVGAADGGGGRPAPAAESAADWRVIRAASSSVLRIGLAVGATASRGLGLRITGHRAGIPPGAVFTTADIDMVRFAGESAESAVLDFKTGADAVVEIAGDPVGWFPVDSRLGRLVEDGPLRGRIRAGDQSPTRPARVVRRRPPLDARVEARIDVRDQLLLETFSFTCRAEAGGIDALVVHFSEPMDDGLQWSAAAPAGVVVTGRRLDPADARRPGGSLDGIAESWLVECSPPITGPARIRASRGIPFTASVPVPLAWVESARSVRGTVVVAANGAARPRVVNRRLRELPADPVGGLPATRALEFAYGEPTASADGLPAAELVPGADVDGRAWAWAERVRCWCHESGATECESTFEIENHGRPDLLLAVPAGRVVESVAVDGIGVSTDALGMRGGTLRIPLPLARRRVDLFVRTLDRVDPRLDAWRVQPLGCTIDVPVLDRQVALLLPPGLEVGPSVAGYRLADEAPVAWMERLLGARPRSAAADRFPEFTVGFREARFVVAAGRIGAPGIIVVSRRLLRSLMALAALVAALATLATARHRPRLAAAMTLVLALGALWAPAPFVAVLRAALWAAVGGVALARYCRPAAAPRGAAGALLWLSFGVSCGTVLGAAPALGQPVEAPAADGAPPVAAVERMPRTAPATRVFITRTARDEMALVPEPLFRVLADAAAGGAARVVGCTVLVPEARGESPWRVVVDLDSDVGATLLLDQPAAGGAWLPPRETDLPAGVLVKVDGRRLRVTAAEAGRHRIVLEALPAVRREGSVVTATVGIPVAPVSTLRLVDELDVPVRSTPGAVACERATRDGPFLPAPEVITGLGEASFDVSCATQVRVVRPLGPTDRLATRFQTLVGINDLTWEADACRVDATFDLDAGGDLIRACVVRADERLVDLTGADGGVAVALDRLVAGRWLVRFQEPVRGRTTLRLRARMPLADPVGVFEVPTILVEGTTGERPTVRLAAAADLEAVLDSAPTPAAAATDLTLRLPQRVTVRRRPQTPRGAQTLVLDFATDRVGITLRAQVEATATALVQLSLEVPPACVIDRVRLADEDASASVDLVWSRTAEGRVTAIVQQPRTGRFRLDVDARIPGPPPAEGPLPLIRADVAGGAPLLVTWRVEPPARLRVPATAPEDRAERAGSLEIADAGPAITYRLSTRRDGGARRAPPEDDDAAPVAVPADGVAGDAIEGIDVFMAFDGHGRARGVVRFDVATSEPVLRIVLPAGARPYDVLVDGVESLAVPGRGDVWEVALHDVGWPRSVLVLFARDFGTGLAGGAPVALTPPTIVGLPAPEVVWTLRPPPDCTLRVSGPTLRVDDAVVARIDEARRKRITARFEEAFQSLGPGNHERLESLFRLRRDGRALPLEASWQDAVGRGSADAGTARVAEAGDAVLTLRVVRVGDATVSDRALATAVLLVGFGLGSLAWFRVSRPFPRSGRASSVPVVALLAALVGGAWALLLVPAWPGWLAVVAAGAIALWRAVAGRRQAASAGIGAGDSTVFLPVARG
jgi:hypothetical protein